MTKQAKVAWAAGLFEGEGCICLTKARGPSFDRPVLQLGMKDSDVVHRFAKIVNAGTVNEYPSRDGMFLWRSQHKADISRILKMFMPYFGERRKAKAKEVLTYCQYKDRSEAMKQAWVTRKAVA